MNQYSTAQLISEVVKRLEAEGPDESLIGSGITVERIELGDENASGCSCCNTDDLAGLPTDDEALAFVAAMALGGTGEFMPVEDEPEHPSDLPVMTFVVTESPTHDPAISHLHAVSRLNPDGHMVQAEISSYCYRTDVPEETERLRALLHGMICEAVDD